MKYILILIMLSAVLISCTEKQSIEPEGTPEILNLSKDTTYTGDTLTIYGDNFGAAAPGNKLIFHDSTEISSLDARKWIGSVIRIEIPAGLSSGTFSVVKTGDTSNAVFIEIEPLPRFEMIEIPGGSFMMGSDKGLANEKPVHTVEISHDFLMSRFEVTQNLWKSVIGTFDGEYVSDDYPAYGMSWVEAAAFCNKLSKMSGLDSCYLFKNDRIELIDTADGYRMPTEAEWEYACSGGSGTDYGGTGNLDGMGWYAQNSGFQPHAVGTKLPNNFGIQDMHGNVREWCWDWYDADYYSVSPVVDPNGPAARVFHVIRGGAWYDGASECRCSNRTFDRDTLGTGIRLVRTIFD